MSYLASRATTALALLVTALFVPAGEARAADPIVVTDFETAGLPPGVFAWGNDTPSTPTLTIVDGHETGGHGLPADSMISQWGGWSHDLSSAQDWSPYATFGFWVRGSGSGQRVFFEIKDGGSGAGSAELWESSFVDDVTGWRQIETPFTSFTRRADFQP